jgi:hypothetical protein
MFGYVLSSSWSTKERGKIGILVYVEFNTMLYLSFLFYILE